MELEKCRQLQGPEPHLGIPVCQVGLLPLLHHQLLPSPTSLHPASPLNGLFYPLGLTEPSSPPYTVFSPMCLGLEVE